MSVIHIEDCPLHHHQIITTTLIILSNALIISVFTIKILIITHAVTLIRSNDGIFMASFELIGIPSYYGIFRTIILNLLLSDHHHCFKPSSMSLY